MRFLIANVSVCDDYQYISNGSCIHCPGHCRNGRPCNKTTGKCDNGCAMSWTGGFCGGMYYLFSDMKPV